MAREKFFAAVAAVALTDNGAVNGTITVAVGDTTGFKVKHNAILSSGTQPNLLVEIKQVPNTSTIIVGPTGEGINTRIDVSAYLLADTAMIEFPAQRRASIPLQEIDRAVYEEEPAVAVRVIAIDKDGNPGIGGTSDINIAEVAGSPPSASNPLPVQLTDGSVNIGTVNAEIEVQLSHQDNVPDAGDVADSVQVGDGTNILGINADGTINLQPAGTSATTNVTSSTSNVTVLAANSSRLGASIVNDGNSRLFLKLGATATTTSFTVKLSSQDSYEVPFGYTGIIDGIWSPNVSGSARVTEFTA